MEFEINAISHHVAASHKQACSDLEKASQFITEALQNEVQRNTILCMLIHHLEERAAENGRSLSEQVESNRQLKLQVDELQKQLENKDNSLTQAKQSIVILTNELTDLQQQMQSHQSSCRTIQEVTEGLQEGESQPNVVKEEDGPLQNVDTGIKEEECYAAVADGYNCTQSDETNSAPKPISSFADIKSEPVQEEDEKSDLSPVVSSDMTPVVSSASNMAPVVSSVMIQSLPDPPSLVKCRRLSVQVVDCCATQGQQRTQDHKSNKDGENPKTGTGGGSQPKSTAAPETTLKKYLCSGLSNVKTPKAHQQTHQGKPTKDEPNQFGQCGKGGESQTTPAHSYRRDAPSM
ncbi:uncharacterized protein LOC134463957 isoform X3 [Engraulis encrasicolus]|uniref:uncharacterized protein LOC134463957 isoform X3 n=1 Tax=Engraulis encrasicolus TaxID=184585 RepID=UPI002FD20565